MALSSNLIGNIKEAIESDDLDSQMTYDGIYLSHAAESMIASAIGYNNNNTYRVYEKGHGERIRFLFDLRVKRDEDQDWKLGDVVCGECEQPPLYENGEPYCPVHS